MNGDYLEVGNISDQAWISLLFNNTRISAVLTVDQSTAVTSAGLVSGRFAGWLRSL